MSYTFTKFREADERPRTRFGRLGRWVRGHRTLAATAAGITLVAAGAAVAGGPLAGAATNGEPAPAGAVRAAAFTAQSGAQTEGTSDAGGGQNVGWLAAGDWLRYNGVDLGAAGTLTTSLRIAAAYQDRPGSVEVRVDSATGPVVATVPVTATGGWQSWKTVTATGTSPGGKHDVFLLIKSDQKQDFVNLNWFAFAGAGTGATPSATRPATPTTGAPAPSASTSTPAQPAPATGWIPVDQAAWQAQLDAFATTVPQAPPPGRGRNPEFNATCTYSHSAPDDPIVFPGIAGASHMHSFFGNRSTNAKTTTESLFSMTDTTCEPVEDHSAYWMPTLYVDGKEVQSNMFIVYYGSLMKDTTGVMPMPNGMRMLQGDAKRQVNTPVGAQNQFYCSGGPLDGVGRSADGNFPICGDGGTVHFTMRFPDCWDGKHVDSPNHKDHVTNGFNDACPPSHPVKIPAVTLSIYFPTAGGKDMKLSSGLASSMHADGFFAWDVQAMNQRVKNCVHQAVACKSNGDF
ncbi:DUF1996 domain-containing protein [Catenuloplanes atrovinosus]|uniref:CBM6 domain-containing protein n=1 Tax=Catenuloplanes atrovinosus TaxID=137266 RepID=A0AAE3YIS0_9ACTN|nr:DUF1996 domain-containing protein [Catenuloplanes atrovinosus]MDR7274250.1 hypothetical protein [Catenuloplanes atrovinosus]